MAFSATLATPAIADNVDRTSYTTASWTPTANRYITVWVSFAVDSGVAVAPTLSGNGIGTWSKVTDTIGGGPGGTAVYVALSGGSPSAGVLTVDFAGVTQNHCDIHVLEVDGADLTGTALSAVRQSAIQNAAGLSSPASLSLTSVPADASRCFASWALNSNTALTPRTNWTELADAGHSAPARRMETQWRSDAAEQTTSVSGWAGSITIRGIIIEIAAAPTPVSPSSVSTAEAHGSPTIQLRSLLFPGGVASDEAHGGATLHYRLFFSSLGSEEAFGTAFVNRIQTIVLSAIDSEEALGSPALALVLAAAGFTDEAIGTALLQLFVTPNGAVSEENEGVPVLALGISPDGTTSEEAEGTPQLNLRLLLAALDSEESVASPLLALPVAVEAITTGEGVGDHTVYIVIPAQDLFPDGIGSEETSGNLLLSLVLTVLNLDSAEVFGDSSLAQLMYMLQIDLDEDDEEPPAPNVGWGLSPDAIASEEIGGTPEIDLRVFSDAIDSNETTGIPSLSEVIIVIEIPSDEVDGQPQLSLVLPLTGITSVFNTGIAKLNHKLFFVAIPTGEEFGMLIVQAPERLFLLPTGIGTVGAFGAPTLRFTRNILPNNILTSFVSGVAKVNLGIAPTRIVSAVVFGALTIRGPILLFVFDRASTTSTILDPHRAEGYLV